MLVWGWSQNGYIDFNIHVRTEPVPPKLLPSHRRERKSEHGHRASSHHPTLHSHKSPEVRTSYITKMNAWTSWLWAFVVVFCLAAGLAQPMPADAMARPARPKTFDSPDDLRTYLNQLGQYYAVAGRPRFGKRTSSRLHLPLIEGLSPRYPYNDPSELYDLLYQPQAD
ncbi:hypothetical protein GE061_002405 [Apolygus lucorum]|uniref:Neuropeptide F n=1 Tax=Apolygus lucorum TaxID=248454 RepID=A0A8S9X921_APOLU|nr:hypothetical protein GE061_002405 [Apolygus lucorum]